MVLAVSTVTWVVFALIWIGLAFWPARVAGRKGHSFFGFFVLSLIFFPSRLSWPTWQMTGRAQGGHRDRRAPRRRWTLLHTNVVTRP